jgi:hypothetical protein
VFHAFHPELHPLRIYHVPVAVAVLAIRQSAALHQS